MDINQKIMDTCPARNNCKQYGKNCSTLCTLWLFLDRQLAWSGIPKRFQKWDSSTLPPDTWQLSTVQRIGLNIIANIEEKRASLYLHGTFGNGKTTVACALAQSYIIEKCKHFANTGENMKHLVKFVNTPEFMSLLKRGMDDSEAREQGIEAMNQMKKVPLLILDDIGAEKSSEWSNERLLEVINHRYDNEMPIYYTSNLTPDELVEQLGGRLRSRISDAIPFEFKGPDRRKKL